MTTGSYLFVDHGDGLQTSEDVPESDVFLIGDVDHGIRDEIRKISEKRKMAVQETVSRHTRAWRNERDERTRDSETDEIEATRSTAICLEAFRAEVEKSAKEGQRATRKAQVAVRVVKRRRKESVTNLQAATMPPKEA